MKKKLKGFTLVEILIVIVIIGILIGALVPRMQSAQGRARDVARKNDLSQLQAAIITSYSDRGRWPGGDDNKKGMSVSDMEDALLGAGLNGIPKDPISTNKVYLGATTSEGTVSPTAIAEGEYGYLVAKKNGVDDAGFVLMAHAEVEGGANRVYCDNNQETHTGNEGQNFYGGLITNDDDLRNIIVCTDMHYHKGENNCGVQSDYDGDKKGGECHYDDPKELRYILTY